MITEPAPRDAARARQRDWVRRLRWRHFELLDALADTGTVRAAALRMNLSQPALSKMLREIETLCATPLFLRSRNGVTPNDFGRALMRQASMLLNQLGAASEELEAIRGAASGLLRVGSVSTTAVLPQALTLLRKDFPQLLVRIREGAPAAMIELLLAGELDCVVSAMPPELLPHIEGRRLLVQPVAPDRLCVVASRAHALAHAVSLKWRDVVGMRWALPPPDALMRQQLVAMCVHQGLPAPSPVIESLSAITMRWLVRFDAQLLGVMRLHQAEEEQALGFLRILPVRPQVGLPDLAFVSRRDPTTQPPVLAALSDALRQLGGGARRTPRA